MPGFDAFGPTVETELIIGMLGQLLHRSISICLRQLQRDLAVMLYSTMMQHE